MFSLKREKKKDRDHVASAKCQQLICRCYRKLKREKKEEKNYLQVDDFHI